ncbi:MAG: sn-glycerol-3-phosphate ABC transporter ATP-binding protein UgpC [Thiohalocapsa sp.]|jgi:multiple sugar transport system ATP-binding protein|uniref:ABC transporter ATP-binding protein n=1 Tax=Thiohalocapsa sp. TaxID=2497641 RepID=UPI0025D5662F|nr:sn-glycerol-3-phosphate ABC transporter ATP-binding protein UgpC [Thiohalocapsa sp.]MCG6943181.1 sn-glycerol-3-phosphate ABC transporter ATP-binding protein UgpC [Thiohalocapsa sp.]
MAEIALENITKRYADGTEALRPTSLTIADGELFVLVGPSGCGKSTLLKLIVGLERPSDGAIRVGGQDVTQRDPKDRNMAMVFQSYALYPHMTVRENMAFPLRLAKLPAPDIDARVEQVAALLELDGLLERRPAALSGGQRQRVAMGRAIVRKPAVFLLDEPLSNLDAKLRGQMRNELARLQRQLRTTTIYVTHDQTEAMTLGQRIAVLRGGAVQQVGSPRELYQRPANLFVARFVGSPAMNLLPARIDGERLMLPMAELPLPEPLRGLVPQGTREVIAGIRPEHIGDADGPAGSGGVTFHVRPELVEWLGADVHVHFDVEAPGSGGLGALQRELDLGAEHGDRLRLIARVGANTPAREGEDMALTLDPAGLLLFDTTTGERLGAHAA